MAKIDLLDLDKVDLRGLVIGDPPLLPTVGYFEPHPTELDQLQSASASGDLPLVKSIFEPQWLARESYSRANAEAFNYALFEAVANDHLPVVDYFLSHGVPPQMRDILRAVDNKSYLLLDLFLEHGWDINEPIDEQTPPPLVKALHSLPLTQWLLSHGSDPNAPCLFATTPLSIAVNSAPLDTILLLFDNGGSIVHGQLLHYAVRRSEPDCLNIVQLLLQKGAAVNQIMFQDHKRSFVFWERFGLGTPLHKAARLAKVDVAELLMKNGADLSIRDSTGRLALDNALYEKHAAMVQLLQSAPAPSPAPSMGCAVWAMISNIGWTFVEGQ